MACGETRRVALGAFTRQVWLLAQMLIPRACCVCRRSGCRPRRAVKANMPCSFEALVLRSWKLSTLSSNICLACCELQWLLRVVLAKAFAC